MARRRGGDGRLDVRARVEMTTLTAYLGGVPLAAGKRGTRRGGPLNALRGERFFSEGRVPRRRGNIAHQAEAG